jgi:membrane-bound serine protease (ClpP class)
MRYGFTDGIVDWLVNPWITLLLVVVGLLALYLEASAPGIGVGAIVAALCGALFFWSRFLGGTAVWLEVILFLAGLAFLAMELFVIPGLGLAGILGIVCLGASFVMAGQDFFWPSSQYEWNKVLTILLVFARFWSFRRRGSDFLLQMGRSYPDLESVCVRPSAVQVSAGEDVQVAWRRDKKSDLGHVPTVVVGDIGSAITVLRPAGRASVCPSESGCGQ